MFHKKRVSFKAPFAFALLFALWGCKAEVVGPVSTGSGSSGTTVQGTATNPAGIADVLSGKEFWNGQGIMLTGTMANRGAFDASVTFPGAGYYNGTVSNLPTASVIASGSTVLGVSGTRSFGDEIYSMVHRTVGTTQITLSSEKSSGNLAAGFREIPQISADDDGWWDTTRGCNGGGGNLHTCTNAVHASRPAATCGTTQTTVAARITHCAAQNAATSTWDSTTKGIQGESIWKLVTRTAAGKEIWQDQRTGLLWSDIVGADNWCKAAGNAEAGDVSGFCNNVAQQPSYPTALSYCAEAAGISPAIGAEDWTTGVYSETKGYMGKVATVSSPAVRWRLPTRSDWLQADIDGIKAVLPDMDENRNYWTATLYSLWRENAWYFFTQAGHVFEDIRTNSKDIRCVGR